MSASDHVVEARSLTKRFGEKVAVDGIDLVFSFGDRVALLGPNGAGKTTTLLMLLGAVTPDSGSILLSGEDVLKHRHRALAHVGFVAGYLPLPENLKVHEALTIFAGLAGIKRPSREVRAAIERFDIGHLADQQSRGLSSGQRTLVSIVKSTLHHPTLLVLDEPTASLDPEIAQRVRNSLLDIHREQGTSLLVTSHNMREVETLCERVVILANGRIAADGTSDEITERFGTEDLEAAFLEIATRSRGERV
jgi:ABC-2 type transport system ATP-binding protein